MRNALFLLTSIAVLANVACSDDSGEAGTRSDAGAGDSGAAGGSGGSGGLGGGGGSGGLGDAGGDSGPTDSFNGCARATAENQTVSGDRKVEWGLGVGLPRHVCMRVKKGATVQWVDPTNTARPADFSFHPLGVFNGDSPSPIALSSSPADGRVTFANVGNFGFFCTIHTTSMMGVIYVED